MLTAGSSYCGLLFPYQSALAGRTNRRGGTPQLQPLIQINREPGPALTIGRRWLG